MNKLAVIMALCFVAVTALAGPIKFTTAWCHGGTPGCPAAIGYDAVSVTAYPVVYGQIAMAELYGSNDGVTWFALPCLLQFQNSNSSTTKGTVTVTVTIPTQANFYTAQVVSRSHK